MRPPELAAIRPHLEQAVNDIDYFLNGEKEREKAERELFELHDLMVADKTPPEAKGRGKRAKLTPEQYAALEWRNADGDPITDEQREAILAVPIPGQPISDEGWAALQFALRGGWRESSRRAAVWLRNAGDTVVADGIDQALRPLFGEPRDAEERSCYREAMRTAADRIRAILAAWLADHAPPVTLTPEGKTILEALANERSMTVTQEDLAGQTRLSDRTIRKYVGELRTHGLVDQPRGRKKGFAITPAGLRAICRE